MEMMTEICQYLKNWFNRKPDGSDCPVYTGTFTVSGGKVVELTEKLAEGQYFRVIGSLFNDGVHKHGDPKDAMREETFTGTVQSMAVPPTIEILARDIADWQEKYGGVDSAAMSPYSSESFGGYSYNKAQGYASAGGGMLTSWQSVFAARLEPWRKI